MSITFGHDSFDKQTDLKTELEKCQSKEIFPKIKYFERLNFLEKTLLKRLVEENKEEFYATLSGYKPACLMSFDKRIPLSFMKSLKSQQDRCVQVITFKDKNAKHAIVINRKGVINQISDNYDLYTDKLSLKKETPKREIYQNLLKTLTTDTQNQSDVLGVTLGYPRSSAMIYNLERIVEEKEKVDIVELRKNIPEYKQTLLKTLNSENAPYKDIFLNEELEYYINNIQNIHTTKIPGYVFIQYLEKYDDDLVRTNSKNFEQNFKVEDMLP